MAEILAAAAVEVLTAALVALITMAIRRVLGAAPAA